MLRVLKSLVEEARVASKPLSICGEIASDTHILPLLVGLGMEDFTVTVAALAEAQNYLSRISIPECKKLAKRCLEREAADEVRDLISEWHDRHI